MLQRILVPLFTFIWWNRLFYTHSYFSTDEKPVLLRSHVVKVKGWKTALLDKTFGGRATVTFILKKIKKERIE